MPDFINNAAQGVVNVAPIPDESLEYLSELQENGNVTDYLITSHYHRDGSVYAAGLTTPEAFNGSLVGIFRLAAPVVLWVVEWTATLIGRYPDVPDPEPPPGWVLADVNCSPDMIVDGPDTVSPIFRISGVYVYALKSPSQSARGFLTQDVSYPYAPWIKDGVLRKVPASTLIPGLLDPAGVRGGGANAGINAGQGALGGLGIVGTR